MKLRIVYSTIILLFALGCGSAQALVHIWYPEEYKLDMPNINEGNGSASLDLNLGRNTIFFLKDGKSYATVIDIRSGGEIYATIDGKDICQVQEVEELR